MGSAIQRAASPDDPCRADTPSRTLRHRVATAWRKGARSGGTAVASVAESAGPLRRIPAEDRLARRLPVFLGELGLQTVEIGELREAAVGAVEETSEFEIDGVVRWVRRVRRIRRSLSAQGQQAADQGLSIRGGRCEGSRFQSLERGEELRFRSAVRIALPRAVRLLPGESLQIREETGRDPGDLSGVAGRADHASQCRQARSGLVEAARREIEDRFGENRQRPEGTAPTERAEEAVETAEVGAGQALQQGSVGHLRPLGGER